MTIGGVAFCSIATIVLILLYIRLSDFYDWKGTNKGLALIVTVFLVLVAWGGCLWYFQNTAKGQRALKTQNSELGHGIQREVIVYDIDGDIIAQYSGKFDLDYTDERIMFDDEEGNRHIIYFKTGTVIVNEVA